MFHMYTNKLICRNIMQLYFFILNTAVTGFFGRIKYTWCIYDGEVLASLINISRMRTKVGWQYVKKSSMQARDNKMIVIGSQFLCIRFLELPFLMSPIFSPVVSSCVVLSLTKWIVLLSFKVPVTPGGVELVSFPTKIV